MKRLSLSIDEAVAEDASVWDEFCLRHGWFWHSTHWREYTLHYRPAAESRSLAFGIRTPDRLVAIVPLMAETSVSREGRETVFSFGGGPCWAPVVDRRLAPEERAAVLEYSLEAIAGRAHERGVERSALRVSPLIHDFSNAAHEFVASACRSGYFDTTTTTRIIDPSRSDAELLAGMTHGHRQSIVRAERTIRIWTSTSEADFETYRELHHLAAGRETRPPETFELMRGWLSTGNAILALAEIGGTPAGAIVVIVFGDGAYYASAANHPSFRRHPVGHGLQWAAIRQLRALGVTRYETGTEQKLPLPHSLPTEKERLIGRFKANFGGAHTPLYTFERFFSPALADRVIRRRLEAYLEATGAVAGLDANA